MDLCGCKVFSIRVGRIGSARELDSNSKKWKTESCLKATRDNNTLHAETSEASSQVSVRVMNILFEKIADSLSTVIG